MGWPTAGNRRVVKLRQAQNDLRQVARRIATAQQRGDLPRPGDADEVARIKRTIKGLEGQG
jgi:hypothetical protein